MASSSASAPPPCTYVNSDTFPDDMGTLTNPEQLYRVLEEYRRALEESGADVDILTYNIASLEKERDDVATSKQAEIEELEESIIHLDSECEATKDALKEKNSECDALSDKVEDLCRAIANSDLARAESEASLHARISLLEEHNADLRIAVQDMSTKYNALQHKFDVNVTQLEREGWTGNTSVRDVASTKLSPPRVSQSKSPLGHLQRRNSTGGTSSRTPAPIREEDAAADWKITLGIDPSEVKISRFDPLSPRPTREDLSEMMQQRKEGMADTHPYYPHHPSASSLWQSSVEGGCGIGADSGVITKNRDRSDDKGLSSSPESKRRGSDVDLASLTLCSLPSDDCNDDVDDGEPPVTVTFNRNSKIARSNSESQFLQPNLKKYNKKKNLSIKMTLSKKARENSTSSRRWLHRLHPSSVVPISYPDEEYEHHTSISPILRRQRHQGTNSNHQLASIPSDKDANRGFLNFDSVVGNGNRTQSCKTIDPLNLTNINIE